MKAREFDKAFDTGKDISQAHWSEALRVNAKTKCVNVDFPDRSWSG